MHLFNYTVQQPTAITQAISGSFTGAKQIEILCAKGQYLELWRQSQDPNDKRLYSVRQEQCFGTIRSIQPFRLDGSEVDYVILGSDSGKIVILQWDAQGSKFVAVHQETFGKTGCRRIVPGQYLAVDARGRATMIAAIEKQKFAYTLNRDTASRLTISSPLEAHRSHTVLYDLVNVDVGYDNPKFACLELNHEEVDADTEGKDVYEIAKKVVSFYELDLGLNNMTVKDSLEVDRTAHHLISVPGGGVGPSGVLVCSENFITYRNINHPEIRVPIPRRRDMPAERGLMIVASSVYRRKKFFFFLVQSELGDLYKVILNIDPENANSVLSIDIRYFDTVPVGTSLLMLRLGNLFVASEFSDHKFYSFESLGDDTTTDNIIGEMPATYINESDGSIQQASIPLFDPHPLLHLKLVQEIESLSPIVDFKVADLMGEGTPQFYCMCGRGPRSSLRVLKHGLAVSEVAVQPLTGSPLAVWTVKAFPQDQFDKYMIVSFGNMTMVLSIGESVAQVFDSGLLQMAPTVLAANIGEGFIQVHTNGFVYVNSETGTAQQWNSERKTVTHAAANESQLVLTLTGGEIIYFGYDESQRQIAEVDRRDMGQDVACLALGPIPEGERRSRFLAIGLFDRTIRVFSLDPDDFMNILTRQALPADPTALQIVELQISNSATATALNQTALFLFVGLNNGIMLRSIMDSTTGELSDTRTRFLGARPVKLQKVRLLSTSGTAASGNFGLLALSSRSWLTYNFASKLHMTPLSYMPLDSIASFNSEQVYLGLVALTGTDLRIMTLESLGQPFHHVTIPLRYTPRKFITIPEHKNLVLIEMDHNALTQSEKKTLLQQQQQQRQAAESDDMMDTTDTDATAVAPSSSAAPSMDRDSLQAEVNEALPEREYGAPKLAPNSAQWASYIRILDPASGTTTEYLELPKGEAAYSLAVCKFESSGSDDNYLVVGTGQNLQLYPRSCSVGFLHVYKFTDNGTHLQYIHSTQVEDVPYALHPFQGRILVGIKNILRLYDIGKKKLLRKCENKNLPNNIISIRSQASRIYVGDVSESFHFLKYKRQENQLVVFADDTSPRWLVSSVLLDYDTIAGSDKFGNIFVCRLPEGVSEDVDDDYSANRWMWERGLLGGAPQKAQEILQFHVGEVVTGLAKTNLVPGGPGVLTYSTVMGTIGVLIPLSTREDVEFFTLLEMQMRQAAPPLSGRDHLSYRSYYYPVKNCIDGDLCEMFMSLDVQKQRSVATEIDERTPPEVTKKLDDLIHLAGLAM